MKEFTRNLAIGVMKKPQIYRYNYFIPAKDLKETFENYSEENLHMFIFFIVIGSIAVLKEHNLITLKEVLMLIDKLDTIMINQDIDELLNYSKDIYQLAKAVFSIQDVNDLRENLQKDKKRYKRLKKQISENDEEIFNCFIAGVKDTLKKTLNTYDLNYDIRFKSPEYDSLIDEKNIGEDSKDILSCIFLTPEETLLYLEEVTETRKQRLNKLKKLNAPDIILENENRLFMKYKTLLNACEQYINKKMEPIQIINDAVEKLITE